MITCPKCKNSLPDWAQTCQFCHTDLKGVARPVAVKKETSYYGQMAKWVWPCYYAISGYIVLIAIVLATLTLLSGPLGVISKIELAVYALILILGLGLLVQNDFIRGIGMYFAAAAAVISLFQTAHIVMYNATVPMMNQQTEKVRSMLRQSIADQSKQAGNSSKSGGQSSPVVPFQNPDSQSMTPDQQKQIQQIYDQLNTQIEQSLPPDKRKAFEQQAGMKNSPLSDTLAAPLKPVSPVILLLSVGNIFVFLLLIYLIYETEHNSY